MYCSSLKCFTRDLASLLICMRGFFLVIKAFDFRALEMLFISLVRVCKDRYVSRSTVFGLLTSQLQRICNLLVQTLRWMNCIEGLLGWILTRIGTALFQVYFGSPWPCPTNAKIRF